MKAWLMKSIKEQKPLEIIYLSKKGEITKRVIVVKKINERLILAYCYKQKQYRYFLTEQILAMQPYTKKMQYKHA